MLKYCLSTSAKVNCCHRIRKASFLGFCVFGSFNDISSISYKVFVFNLELRQMILCNYHLIILIIVTFHAMGLWEKSCHAKGFQGWGFLEDIDCTEYFIKLLWKLPISIWKKLILDNLKLSSTFDGSQIMKLLHYSSTRITPASN